MAGARFDLVALGEPLLEFNQITPDDATGYRQGFGGDTSNCTIAAARLGARTAYVTRLGDDAFGRMFIDLWRREGVDVSGVGIDADAPTGIYFVTHGAQRTRVQLSARGVRRPRACGRAICRSK